VESSTYVVEAETAMPGALVSVQLAAFQYPAEFAAEVEAFLSTAEGQKAGT